MFKDAGLEIARGLVVKSKKGLEHRKVCTTYARCSNADTAARAAGVEAQPVRSAHRRHQAHQPRTGVLSTRPSRPKGLHHQPGSPNR
jgi:hypothetical protein